MNCFPIPSSLEMAGGPPLHPRIWRFALGLFLSVSCASSCEAKLLKKDTLLPYCHNMTLVFRGRTNVQVQGGYVVSGVLAQNSQLNYGGGTVVFRAGTVVVFRSSAPRCQVKQGVLDHDAQLRFLGKKHHTGTATFRGGTTVVFNASGQVISPAR